MAIERPKTAELRDAVDLAQDRCTKQAVYQAVRRGWLPVIPLGRLKKMTASAFEYHMRFGWGPGVLGTAPQRRSPFSGSATPKRQLCEVGCSGSADGRTDGSCRREGDGEVPPLPKIPCECPHKI